MNSQSRNFSIHADHSYFSDPRELCDDSGGNYITDAFCEPGHTCGWATQTIMEGCLLACMTPTRYGIMYQSTLSTFQPTTKVRFCPLAADTFAHESHGDMVFLVRDASKDNFRFVVGPNGGADDPSTMPLYTKARINSLGAGYFNGGVSTGGADFAESVAFRGERSLYEPGDVLVIDQDADRRVNKASNPYSTLVAGIYSTNPAINAGYHEVNEKPLKSEIPVAVTGIVPCKVTAENGQIVRGDLLVTSSKPGYAMKGTNKKRMAGAVIGKALQTMDRNNDTGVIDVLVALR